MCKHFTSRGVTRTDQNDISKISRTPPLSSGPQEAEPAIGQYIARVSAYSNTGI